MQACKLAYELLVTSDDYTSSIRFGGIKMTISTKSIQKFIALKSIRTLRPMFKDATASDVQEIIEQLIKLKHEKIKEEEDLSLNQLARISESYKPMLGERHIPSTSLRCAFEPQDIMDALIERFSCKTRRYRSARVKYRFTDLEGNLCEWSGQGREPIKLRELLKHTGQSREDFLVNDDTDENALLHQAIKNYSQNSSDPVPLTDSQRRLERYTMQIEERQRSQEMARLEAVEKVRSEDAARRMADEKEFLRMVQSIDKQVCGL